MTRYTWPEDTRRPDIQDTECSHVVRPIPPTRKVHTILTRTRNSRVTTSHLANSAALGGDPHDQARLEASIAIPAEWVSHPRRHKLKIKRCELLPRRTEKQKPLYAMSQQKKAFPFYTLHNADILETRVCIPGIPFRLHPFHHPQIHIYILSLYPWMYRGYPLMTTVPPQSKPTGRTGLGEHDTIEVMDSLGS